MEAIERGWGKEGMEGRREVVKAKILAENTKCMFEKFRGAPQYCQEFHDQLWLFHEGCPSKKGKGTNRTGGSTILKLIWGANLLYFPGFGDLQPYETWKFRVCSESVSRVFPDLFRISLQECLTCDPEVALQTPKPRKIPRHEKVTQK